MSERFAELIQELGAEFEQQAALIRALRHRLRNSEQAWSGTTADGCDHDPVRESDAIHTHTENSFGPIPAASQPLKKLETNLDVKTTISDPKGAETVDVSGAPPSRSGTFKPAATTTTKATSRSTETFRIRKPWYLINPERSSFMSRWDIITMFALCYVALVTPVQVGLMESKFDPLFVISTMIDFIFLFDMGLQFFLMYPVKKTGGFELEHRPRRIILHYLGTWFPVDLLTILPFDLLSLMLAVDELSQMKSIKIVRLLRLLKLVRILKASRVFHRMEIGMSVPYQRFALMKFLLILLLVCHWQACIWAMTLSLTDGSATARWIDSLDDMEKDVRYKTKDSAFRLYLVSFYFCSYTMTSVGYGDIGPRNILERFVCILIILLSGLCWAYILGEVCGIVGDMNADAQSFRKKMDNLNFMMSERGLNYGLRKRLRSYFLSNKEATQHVTQKELLSGMSPSLQGEVSMALNGAWLQKVPFLGGFLQEAEQSMRNPQSADSEHYRACVSDVARILDTISFAQGETFGEVQVLYILYKGLVGLQARVLKMGAVWGEDFVLSDRSVVRKPVATALTYVETVFATRTAFMEVVKKHTFSCPVLALRVRQFCVRLATRRGIIAEAKRRLAEEKSQRSQIRLRNLATTSPSPPPEPELAETSKERRDWELENRNLEHEFLVNCVNCS